MTPVYGITENQLKTTGKAVQVLPKIVIYDPALSLNLPAEISAYSGMNAMAHAVEALYAENKKPDGAGGDSLSGHRFTGTGTASERYSTA
ncbi:hypothetical protein [Acinetobacter indicus]